MSAFSFSSLLCGYCAAAMSHWIREATEQPLISPLKQQQKYLWIGQASLLYTKAKVQKKPRKILLRLHAFRQRTSSIKWDFLNDFQTLWRCKISPEWRVGTKILQIPWLCRYRWWWYVNTRREYKKAAKSAILAFPCLRRLIRSFLRGAKQKNRDWFCFISLELAPWRRYRYLYCYCTTGLFERPTTTWP